MKNAFLRFGLTCVSVAVLTGLATAGTVNRVTVKLPHAVTVGSVTLPGGEYTLTGMDMSDDEFFVVRGDHTPTVTLRAQKIDTRVGDDATSVVFSQDGSTWHFDKLFVQGDSVGYQFIDSK